MRHETSWSEDRVLAYFWAMVREGSDRVALLQQVSVVVIARDELWSKRAQRAATLSAEWKKPVECFCCKVRDRALDWHHIVGVANGGSTRLLNMVAICRLCHGRIHPWLEPERRPRWRWASMKQLVGWAFDLLVRRSKRAGNE